MRALGFGSDQEILDLVGENEYLRNTLDKDNTENSDKAPLEIYERLRPGEPPTVENAKSLLDSRFFDPKRYDLANVGRYKINKNFILRIVSLIRDLLKRLLTLKQEKSWLKRSDS